MNQVVIYAYLAAAVLFVFALKLMSSYKTARLGNLLGALGMLIAIGFTFLTPAREAVSGWPGWEDLHVHGLGWWWVLVGMGIGTVVGAFLALTVKMTGMPQMVAMFNGLGGLASALVVLANIWQVDLRELDGEFTVAVGLSTLIGWVTFTGSLVAFSKLQEFLVTGRPVTWKLQRPGNLAVLAGCLAGVVLMGLYPEQRWVVVPLAVLAAGLGIAFTLPIGGADMPVVISLLNSCSGLAACATGFVLKNPGLIIAGSLVGSSGIILTRIMCVGMNRSLAHVLFGAVGGAVQGSGGGEEKRATFWSPEDAAYALNASKLVFIVPGYGMAVAQAQHAVKELADALENRGIEVKFGIHEVAGRMPGHMNVLLAEAEVPYEKLSDREETNAELDRADAVIVLGANDVVNPSARHDKSSPLYGMPILDVDKAGTVMVCKRSLNPGFAGVDNELFYQENTAMVLGDGKATITAILAALKTEV